MDKWAPPGAYLAHTSHVDGKRVQFMPPAGCRSFFYNYKGYHSIVLVGIVNANYEFISIDFGVDCPVSDGGVLEYVE
jgi:hypothetical protein